MVTKWRDKETGEIQMKLLRILIALIIPTLILISLSFIPDNPGTAYPIPTPLPPIPGGSHEGLALNYATCRTTSIEWQFRAPQFEVDRFEVWYCNPWGTGCWIAPAPFFWGNQEVEYWTTGNMSVYTFGNDWDVQGKGYHPFEPDMPIYLTDIIHVDCTNVIVKSRIHIPGVFSKWRYK